MAITRQDPSGQPAGGWHPEQRLTIDEAIRAYTINPAWSAHEENVKGSITAGKLADLVVLSRDIRNIPPQDLLKTEVRYTIVGGRIVHGETP
jgi:predicted amidohydrolase YtcJ